jgi:uncharacterized membrane protein
MRRPGAAGVRRVRRRDDVGTPKGATVGLGTHYDPEAFGRFSEAIARYFGTARFLAIQTVIVIGWIALNSLAFFHHWDPYPFILLNLLFSTQAAYAAPLILLAQNRQDERDRENVERDRQVASRTQSDTEFLARELAAVRLSLAGMATADDLNSSMSHLETVLTRVETRFDQLSRSQGLDPTGTDPLPGD